MDIKKIKVLFLILKKTGIKRFIIKIISYLDTRISLFFLKVCSKKQQIFIKKKYSINKVTILKV